MRNAQQTETEKRDRAGGGGLCLIALSGARFIIHRSSFSIFFLEAVHKLLVQSGEYLILELYDEVA